MEVRIRHTDWEEAPVFTHCTVNELPRLQEYLENNSIYLSEEGGEVILMTTQVCIGKDKAFVELIVDSP